MDLRQGFVEGDDHGMCTRVWTSIHELHETTFPWTIIHVQQVTFSQCVRFFRSGYDQQVGGSSGSTAWHTHITFRLLWTLDFADRVSVVGLQLIMKGSH